MIRIIQALIILLLTLSLGGIASAKDCSEEKDSVSIAQCHEQRYSEADKELNSVYSQAMKSLSDTEKQKLREAQKAWLKYRDSSFEFYIEKNKEMRSYGSIAVGDYKATLVEKRVQELKYILSGPEGPPVEW